jgi:MoxR-like ATPase
MTDSASLVQRVLGRVVGRAREVELVVAALAAGRHVLLEGPPGTGKSTLLCAVAHERASASSSWRATPSSPRHGWSATSTRPRAHRRLRPEVYEDGPLVTAMRDGSLLYVEEINRIPEETLNVLITVMSERELHVPRLGRVAAHPGFRLVAAMNPFDAIGTARISSAVYDRVPAQRRLPGCADEVAIVAALPELTIDAAWLARVVEVVRLSRTHPDVRSARRCGAIDTAGRGVHARRAARLPGHHGQWASTPLVALGRLRMREGCSRSADDGARAVAQVFVDEVDEPAGDGDASDGSGKATAPAGATDAR